MILPNYSPEYTTHTKYTLEDPRVMGILLHYQF